MGLKSTAGEIVQVQGGHIIRATGRKDRHSKVFTAKGPRDRRVRLSAHTAIQFYDVQDRLGYDRPSKAVDWLIKKAKASIDKLAELPPWDPTATAAGTSAQIDANVGTSDIPVGDDTGPSSAYYVTAQDNSVSLSDSMKSFFPATSSGEHQINFQNYPQGLMSRSSNLNNHQDLGLSLHTSLQDHEPNTHHHHQSLFQGSGSLGFDIGGSSGWSEPSDMARFTRMMGWSSGGGGGSGGERMFFNSTELAPQQQQHHHHQQQQALLLGQQGAATATVAYSQRGTLQSSLSQSVRAMEDDQHNYHSSHHHHHQASISSIGHGSDSFMGFCIPSQLHGHHNELHGGGGGSLSNRASSSSLSPDSSQH